MNQEMHWHFKRLNIWVSGDEVSISQCVPCTCSHNSTCHLRNNSSFSNKKDIIYNHDLTVTQLTILRVQPIQYYAKLFYISELWKYLSNKVSLLPPNSTDSWKLWWLNVNHNALFTLISNGIFRNLGRQKPVPNWQTAKFIHSICWMPWK